MQFICNKRVISNVEIPPIGKNEASKKVVILSIPIIAPKVVLSAID
jgi:hypothetical protein